MANLTTKELAALEDQLGLEGVLCCKYEEAAQQCTDPHLQQQMRTYAKQHKNNYANLLGYLQ